MARFSRLDNQAPSQSELDAAPINVGRSVHDFSFIHSGNALFGALFPVDCFDVVPNETVQINLNSLFEFRNPTTRQLLNGMRVYFHAYYNRLTDLWEGARNFLDTGRSGDISLKRPKLIYNVTTTATGISRTVNACTPLSLLNYLGLPAEAVTAVTSDYTDSEGVIHEEGTILKPLYQFSPASDNVFKNEDGDLGYIGCYKIAESPDFFPADCAFAYQRNWRDFYSNKNLLQNNKFWFPDNEDHFILSYACEEAVCIQYEDESLNDSLAGQFQNISGMAPNQHFDEFGHTVEPNNPSSVGSEFDEDKYYPNLSGLKFRQFRGDRFTASLPFPDLIRGSIPALQPESNTSIDFSDSVSSDGADGEVLLGLSGGDDKLAAGNASVDSSDPDSVTMYINAIDTYHLKAALEKAKLKNIGSISLNDIRALETFTVFKERMARTNGDYNDMIEAQFGYNPHVHDRKGSYIGGFYQDFALSSVTQTSESSNNSPLGTKAGVGLSSGSGNIGSFSVPDFGWIQIYASIVYTPMYTQGISRMFSKKIQTDMYFPIFNNLAPQAILNKELFISGNVDTDNDVFSYEDRYAEYKSRTNRVSGFMGLSHNLAAYDASRIMSRRFTSTPALNTTFVSMIPENVDMEVFSVVDEPPIDFSVGVSVRRSFPGPYTAIPGGLSSNLHA